MGEILINQLFAGSYLQEGSNIGHEAINIFKDDNDCNYLFITPKGTVKGHSLDTVLFVQNIKARETMEVVMKAELLSDVTYDEIRNVYYAGVNIEDIFSNNLYHGKKDEVQSDIMITYRAEKVRLPRKGKRVILTVDSNYVPEDENTTVITIDNKSKIVGQGMRTYLSEGNYPNAYRVVSEIINNESLWEEYNTTQKLVADDSYMKSSISILEIIRKENDEIIMSNLLAYYFKYNHKMFVKFTEEVLNIKEFGKSFEIIRESMNNIDLWIQDENNIIVIENKIKSGINGKNNEGTQLDKYYNFAEKYKKTNNIDNAYYYVFAPNYNDISINNEHFRVIYYSQIFDFFSKNAVEYLNEKYFPDFISSLRNQTMTDSELKFSIMRSRFLERINQR